MPVAQKNVAIIGGAGFVGSALVRELLHSDMKVVSYDNYLHGTRENFEGLEEFLLSEQFVQVEGDVFNESLLKKQIKSHAIDYLINCIGDPFIPTMNKAADRGYAINAQGTQCVLEACSAYNVERFIHVSTCEVHGINDAPKLSEHANINPLVLMPAQNI